MSTPTNKPTEQPAQPPAPRINTPCPACGRAALMLDAGGRLVCAAVPGRDGQDGCPDPTRLARMCAAEQQPAPAPDWLAPVMDAECATAILRTAQWTPATREAMDQLLAARADAYARWLASTDAGRLVAEGRRLRDEAFSAWLAFTGGEDWDECRSEIELWCAWSGINTMLALAEAAASDRAALATVTRERDAATARAEKAEAALARAERIETAARDYLDAVDDESGQAVALATLREALAAHGAADAPAAKPAPQPASVPAQGEPLYPCDDCGALRTKAEGGTTFTVCDKCWDKHHGKPAQGEPQAQAQAWSEALPPVGELVWLSLPDYPTMLAERVGNSLCGGWCVIRCPLVPGLGHALGYFADAYEGRFANARWQRIVTPEAWSDSPEPGLHWISEPDARAPDLVRVYVGGETGLMRFSHVGCTEAHDVEEYAAAGARFMRVATPLPPQGEPEASNRKGCDVSEFPADLRVREFPTTQAEVRHA